MENSLIGLNNLGNTCFINSCIQIILSSKGVLNEIRTRNVSGDIDKSVQKITFSETGLPIQKDEVCALLMNIYERDNPDYQIGQSQDCSEFLTYYFEYLKTTDQKITIETRTTESDGTLSVTEGTEDILFLPIPSTSHKRNEITDIYDCFDEYRHTEFENTKGKGTVEYKIKSTGKQIFIGLKRFAGTMFMGSYVSYKVNRSVEMYDEITIPVNDVPTKYTLVAMILHVGELHGGHYIAYRKIHGQWTFADDSHVGFLCDGEFNRGYIYVYEC